MDFRIIAEVWVPIVGLLLGLPLLIVAALQIRQASTFKSADLVNELTARFYNSGASETFMTLIYNSEYRVPTDEIDKTVGKGNSESNHKIRSEDFDYAKLLDFLNSVCFCLDKNMLIKKVVVNTVLGYAIAQTHKHAATSAYLEWVDKPDPHLGRQSQAFKYFRDQAPKIQKLMYPDA